MKSKCPECGTGKARRQCPRVGQVEICSSCCASIRDPECGDCTHYMAATRYEVERYRAGTGPLPKGLMMEINPEVSAKVDRALQTVECGDLEGPQEILNGLYREHPRHHDVAYGIGVVHAFSGRYQESVEWFDRALEIDPYSLEARFNRAVSFKKLLLVGKYLRDLRKIVEIGAADDPLVCEARSQLNIFSKSTRELEGIGLDDYLRAGQSFDEGFDLMNSGNWSGALEALRSSASINETNAPCHGNMGICHAALGHKAEALAELDRALEIDPEYEPASSNRKVFEGMTEGQPMDKIPFTTVDFAAERLAEKQRLQSGRE